MEIITHIQNQVAEAILSEYNVNITPGDLVISLTKREFSGDYTIVTFPLTRQLKHPPHMIAESLGKSLLKDGQLIQDYNVIKGFLNISLQNDLWGETVKYLKSNPDFWKGEPKVDKAMVEFASPNTNKPLHLGHIRNILLGWSSAKILEANGHQVIKTQIVNDRGIAICKSMLAWTKFANGETPGDSGKKPDHFVGNWYVRFEAEFQEEYKRWQVSEAGKEVFRDHAKENTSKEAFFKTYKNAYFNLYSDLGRSAKSMLLKWEAEDPEIRALWKMMNSWVYSGFKETYHRLGVSFDRLYYESETYLLGKSTIQEGLDSGIFYRKPDQSVWVDMSDEGLDEKLLLRSDGTSVYMTQDIGTAETRYADFNTKRMIYVVADEQNYHFDVLFKILKKLGAPYADGMHHLSYGMVDLPTGKMKSREGTVVDADDLIDEVIGEAAKAAEERGEIEGVPKPEQEEIIRKIGLAALKYHIIKVDAKRRMVFDPKESVDLQGQTGPYIQNAYVRIQSILRKGKDLQSNQVIPYDILVAEKQLLAELLEFKAVVQLAANQYNPALVANFAYSLAKTFHRYYHEYHILNAETDAARDFRLELITIVADVLKSAMELLGIEMPQRM